MRYTFLFYSLIIVLTCTAQSELGNYDVLLSEIKTDRLALKSENQSMDSCRSYFLHQFEDRIFPHWVGTKWDYNGHTNRPGSDKLIACGYFVSTTLKHMGFNWNRYDLAKMYSKAIVEQTCEKMTKYASKPEALKAVLSSEDNLYIVGLDMHVGFLLKRNNTVYFVHSNYYGTVGPEKEIAKNSMAFDDSVNYYIGKFLTDRNIKRWLNGTLFTFVRD